MIGMNGERKSGKSMLAAWPNDDDDDDDIQKLKHYNIYSSSKYGTRIKENY